jgi:hypothetical protein
MLGGLTPMKGAFDKYFRQQGTQANNWFVHTPGKIPGCSFGHAAHRNRVFSVLSLEVLAQVATSITLRSTLRINGTLMAKGIRTWLASDFCR